MVNLAEYFMAMGEQQGSQARRGDL